MKGSYVYSTQIKKLNKIDINSIYYTFSIFDQQIATMMLPRQVHINYPDED